MIGITNNHTYPIKLKIKEVNYYKYNFYILE